MVVKYLNYLSTVLMWEMCVVSCLCQIYFGGLRKHFKSFRSVATVDQQEIHLTLPQWQKVFICERSSQVQTTVG